jgi:hypothetical protein
MKLHTGRDVVCLRELSLNEEKTMSEGTAVVGEHNAERKFT